MEASPSPTRLDILFWWLPLAVEQIASVIDGSRVPKHLYGEPRDVDASGRGTMLHFAWPWMALLLPLPWIHYRLRRVAEPSGSALFLPYAATLTAPKAGVTTQSNPARLLFVVIWSLLLVATMRPQWVGDPLPVATSGRRLLLAVDVSGSMATQDMAGGLSRLAVVQQVAGQFIDRRGGDQVGLILFGTQPYLQAPLTADLATVHRFLDEAVVGVAGTQTAIGDAIGLAIKRLRADVGTGARSDPTPQTVLVLLTDGQNDAGVVPPLEAARLAAQEHLRIYTIGVGAAPGSGFYDSGNIDLDEDTLKSIAKVTGGESFRATDAAALQAIYREIDKLEPVAGRQQWLRPESEWFRWPLTLALLLSVPATCGARRVWT
jgi:Ca-activated chloride channel homolog